MTIPQGAAVCLSSGGTRVILVGDMVAGLTGGLSGTYAQAVTANVWLYRWNGSSWVYQTGRQSSASIDYFAKLPTVSFAPSTGGYYHIVVQFTWWVDMNHPSYVVYPLPPAWVKSATSTYELNSSADYVDSRGKGPGYCTV